MRPRLLVVVTRAELGGAQVHVAGLLDGLRDRADLHLVSGEEGWLTGRSRAAGISTTVLPELCRSVDPRQDLRAVRRLRGLVRGCDLVSAHSSKAGVVCGLAATGTGVPVVFTAHGWAFGPGFARSRRLLATASTLAVARTWSHVVTVSRTDGALARSAGVIRLVPVTTVHNGVPDRPVVPARNRRDGPLRVVCVSRLAPPKDVPTLLHALSQVPDVLLSVVGDGPQRADLEALAQELQVADRVAFLGARLDVPELLEAADAVVLSSVSEGLPLAVLEGLRAGRPVVASEVGGVSEALGGAGLLVPARDPGALAGALQSLLDDAVRLDLGAAGRTRYFDGFTESESLARLWEVYAAVLASGRLATAGRRARSRRATARSTP